MSKTTTDDKNLPKSKDTNTVNTISANDVVEFEQNIQESTSENKITESVISDTEYRELDTEWFDSVIITFQHKDGTQTKSQFAISSENTFLDENLRYLYNFLDVDPNKLKDHLIGEKVPSMSIEGEWYVYIPDGFTKESIIMNKLLNSMFTDPARPNPEINSKINLLYILTVVLISLSVLFNSSLILVSSAVSFVCIFYVSNIKFRGKLV